MSHGIVIGKFYPPHRGHEMLIRTAAAACQAVTVVVEHASSETVSGPERAQWLAAAVADLPHVRVTSIASEAPVDYRSDAIWTAQTATIAAAVRHARPGLPATHLFTSEEYGARLGHALGCTHVLVDLDRTTVPVSASRVRADLDGQWDQLPAAVRAGMVLRAVVLGSESTGTTTLSQAIAAQYRARGGAYAPTAWIGEYGREHTAAKLAVAPGGQMDELTWHAEDFTAIAAEQDRRENAAAPGSGRLLVCDTDALATRIWEHRYSQDPAAAAAAAVPTVAGRRIYLVTDHTGVPFTQDGMRDGEHLRAAMTGQFIDMLTALGQPWVLLTGDHATRMRTATTVLDRQLTEIATFGPALG